MARFDLPTSSSFDLVRAAHPRQALLTALGLAAAAAVSGRPTAEVLLVLGTVLVGQAILGWHDDLVDASRDERHDVPGKPLAQRRLDRGTVVFAIACAVLLLVPLSVSHGLAAATAYLLSVAVGLLGNVLLRSSVLSFLPWAISFGLYPAFLAYGGWDAEGTGTPPTIAMTALFALLGVAVHVLRALPGLVADNQDGLRSLPLRMALRIGAPRLLVVASVATAAIAAGILVVGQSVGLRQ